MCAIYDGWKFNTRIRSQNQILHRMAGPVMRHYAPRMHFFPQKWASGPITYSSRCPRRSQLQWCQKKIIWTITLSTIILTRFHWGKFAKNLQWNLLWILARTFFALGIFGWRNMVQNLILRIMAFAVFPDGLIRVNLLYLVHIHKKCMNRYYIYQILYILIIK